MREREAPHSAYLSTRQREREGGREGEREREGGREREREREKEKEQKMVGDQHSAPHTPHASAPTRERGKRVCV